MLYYIWRFLGKNFWMRLSTHYSHPKTGERYFAEWRQKRNEIRDNLTYKLIGAKNPKPQKV